MKKLLLTTLALVSIHLSIQPGFVISISNFFGEKTPEIEQILMDRYGSLVLSLKIKAQQEAAIVERVMQENKHLMDDLESETKEAALALQTLAYRLQGEAAWFASDEWLAHVRTMKKGAIKPLSQFLPIYLKNSSLIKADLQKIRTIIADLKNPSEKITALANDCAANIKANNGELQDASLRNQLATLREGNDLLACLFWMVDGVLNDKMYVKKQLEGNAPQQTEVLVNSIVPFARETVADFTPIIEQALDARLQNV